MFIDTSEILAKRTRFCFVAMRLLGTPLWALLGMLVYILYKHVGLTSFQVACIVALKPASSLLSPYWSQAIYKRPNLLMVNLFGANFLRYVFFLWIPWSGSSWLIIFAFGLYMTLTRATIPAWTEIFQRSLPERQRERLVGYATTIDYLGTALMSVILGMILDFYPTSWRGIFAIFGLLGLLSTGLLFWIEPIAIIWTKARTIQNRNSLSRKIKQAKIRLIRPWKKVYRLVSEQNDFFVFQVGFMLGGSALMIIQPALPQFFLETLDLSFVEMGCAIALCKGVGVAFGSPIWTKLFRKVHIFRLSSLVTLSAAIFPFFLLAACSEKVFVYAAYALYGIMQAGSEMSWHMSSLVFAKGKDSSLFSIANVLTVGIRGCLVPLLGSFLLEWIYPVGVILMSAFLALTASFYFRYQSPSFAKKLL